MIGSFFGRILLLVVSIIIIILGVLLTFTLVFAFIGIPLIIIGGFLFLISVLSLVFGTFGDLFRLIRKPFRRKPYIKKENIIELEKRRGVYRAK